MTERAAAYRKCSCPLTRRAVLQAGAAGLASLVLPGCGGEDGPGGAREPYGTGVVSGTTLTLDLADGANAPLQAVDGAVFVTVPGDLLIVVRTAEAGAIALSAYCTHSGCLVGYEGSRDALRCPCHGSRFAQSGDVLRGPAVDPLRSYAATIAGQTITVSLA